MPDGNMSGVFASQNDNRGCSSNNGGLFENSRCGNSGNSCCDSEILFFIIIFLLLFTNFGCCGCGRG